MLNKTYLNHEIDHLKGILQDTVQEYEYDFRHPEVISVSQKLDHLILQIMQEK